ncbi:MAG: hypothetical protein Q9170_005367 [Blastenia crenularia]
MSDPLSIAVAVASSVATAGKLLNSIQSYWTRYKATDLSALSIKAQCDCILVALGQIQATLLSKQQLAARLMSDQSISGQSLKSVLGACEITFLVMVDRLNTVDKCIRQDSGSSARDKLSRLWNESEINGLSQNISRLSDGLNLLLTALNTKSQLDVLEVLTSERASIILERVSDDASSILFSGQNESLISRVTSKTLDEDLTTEDVDLKDFSFDQEVLMTPAYRKIKISSQQHLPGSRAECVELGNIGSEANPHHFTSTLDSSLLETMGTVELNPVYPREESRLEHVASKDTSGFHTLPVLAENEIAFKERLANVTARIEAWDTSTGPSLISNTPRDTTEQRTICHIKSLKTLHLSLNEIDELPSSFENLTNLEFLNIACNKLIDLPLFLANMPNLRRIYAHGNPYISNSLQMWQAQYGTYVPFPSAEMQATIKLKKALQEQSISTSISIPPHMAVQQGDPSRQHSMIDQDIPSPDVSNDSNDAIKLEPKVLRRFAKSAVFSKRGEVDWDIFMKAAQS